MHHLLLLVAMAVPALAQSNDFAHIPLPAELSGTLTLPGFGRFGLRTLMGLMRLPP